MKLFKRILLSITAVAILGYLTVSVYYHRDRYPQEVCLRTQLVVSTPHSGELLITDRDIAIELEHKRLNPIGKRMSMISTQQLEQTLGRLSLVKSVQVSKQTKGILAIQIEQRYPIVRVMANGADYYLDEEGVILDVVNTVPLRLPLVTGYCDKSFACSRIHKFALYLQNHKFWDAQIEQIYVRRDSIIELIPRVGSQVIILGRIDNFEEKLDNLKTFYLQGLNQIGWEQYKTINLSYRNQIVCEKKE